MIIMKTLFDYVIKWRSVCVENKWSKQIIWHTSRLFGYWLWIGTFIWFISKLILPLLVVCFRVYLFSFNPTWIAWISDVIKWRKHQMVSQFIYQLERDSGRLASFIWAINLHSLWECETNYRSWNEKAAIQSGNQSVGFQRCRNRQKNYFISKPTQMNVWEGVL